MAGSRQERDTTVSGVEQLARFVRKPFPEKWAALKATFFQPNAAEERRLHALLTGKYAAPSVLQSAERMYIAYRPDSEFHFESHPEIATLSQQWVRFNTKNNAGDLPRLYALIFNIKQIMEENIPGEMAELGVYKGNSAAMLAHFAKQFNRRLILFDTFSGFDQRDLVGTDQKKDIEFIDTSLDQVRALVGDKAATFVQGRFPESIPPSLFDASFAVVHVDCDLYEPAKTALEFFYPRLSPGGLLIIHDYANPYWPGIKSAVDEYCRLIPERPLVFNDKSGTAMIRKASI